MIFIESNKYYQWVVVNRGRRLVSSLSGISGTLAVVLGGLGLLVLSFVGSSASVSSSARLALHRDDVRRAVAEKLVDRLEEGGSTGVKIIIRVARSKVIDAVELSLNDNKLRDVAGDIAATAYGVFVEGAPRAVVNIQMFADVTFKAIQSVDRSIPHFFSPRIAPLDISPSDRDPDFSGIHTWTRIATWALLIGGLVLLTISWFVSVVGKCRWWQGLGARFVVVGPALILLAYVVRSVTFGDDSRGHLVAALVSFATGRLILWSSVLTVVGVAVVLLAEVLNRMLTGGGGGRLRIGLG